MAKKKSLKGQRIAVLGTTEARDKYLFDGALTRGYKLFVVSTRPRLTAEDGNLERVVGKDRIFLLTEEEYANNRFDASWRRFYAHFGLPWPKSSRTGEDETWVQAMAKLPDHGVANHHTIRALNQADDF